MTSARTVRVEWREGLVEEYAWLAERTLFMPRYVYYFADEARFVMGETLNAAGSLRTVYPNGTPATSVSSAQSGP